MFPWIYLPLSGTKLPSFSVLLFVGWLGFLATGLVLTWGRRDLRRHWFWLFVIGIGSLQASSIVARMIYEDPLDILRERGAPVDGVVNYFGGPVIFITGSLVYLLFNRVSLYPMLDVFAAAYSVAGTFHKLACFSSGCCRGRPTGSPLGLACRAPLGDDTVMYPVQIFEASFHLLTACLLILLFRSGKLRGRLFLVYGICYGSWRFLVEPLRFAHPVLFMGGPLTVKQTIALVAALTSALGLIVSETRIGKHYLARI